MENAAFPTEPPVTGARLVADTVRALVLGAVLAMLPIVLWLAFAGGSTVLPVNPFASRFAVGLDVRGLDDPRVAAIREDALRRAEALDRPLRVFVTEDAEGVWLEILRAPLTAETGIAREAAGEVWNGKIVLGGPRIGADHVDGEALRGLLPVLPLLFGASAFGFAWVGWRRRRSARPEWETPRGSVGHRVLLGLGGGIVALGAVWLVGLALAPLGLAPEEQPMVLALAQAEGPLRVLFVVLVGIAAPIGEELFFRGHIFRGLAADGRRRAAYGFSTVLFAAVHLHPAAIAAYVVYALILGRLYEQARWIGTPILAHMVVNLTGVALLIHG